MFQARLVSRSSVRKFSRTPIARKGPVEGVKEGLKAVDRTVSNAAVKGIEKGEEAAQKAKEATGVGKAKASEAAGEAKDKMKEAASEAKGKAEEAKGKM